MTPQEEALALKVAKETTWMMSTPSMRVIDGCVLDFASRFLAAIHESQEPDGKIVAGTGTMNDLAVIQWVSSYRPTIGDSIYATPPAPAIPEGMESLHQQVEELTRERDRFEKMCDALLNHCDKEQGECSVCSTIVCPSGDPYHFHHDGCPSCAGAR